MPPRVDLVIVFRTVRKSESKQLTLQRAQHAEQQYTRLLDTLKTAGLRAVGRRGKKDNLMIFIWCPLSQLACLMRKARRSDFCLGLPLSNALTTTNPEDLSPADRIRLVHDYITCTTLDGGLNITPGSTAWDLVDSVIGLHDHSFNETWLRSWTAHRWAAVKLETIRDQFGDSVALYFAFLSTYTQALIFPSVLGIVFYFFGSSYSPVYSVLLLIWSITFVEWWRVRERILSLRWGTRGSFRVEKRRSSYQAGFPWWKRELRIVASIPVILLFAVVLATLLMGIFIFEAFVTHLYTGPGQKYIAFAPTVLFIAVVPRLLAIYQVYAKRFTSWENHKHQSSHDASLTLKTFALTAVVAYLGLALSAFVYVPFGESIMRYVQARLFEGFDYRLFKFENGTIFGNKAASETVKGIWDTDSSTVRMKLNPRRLRDQLFAETVTNQVINTFNEIGLPFILRFLFSPNRSSSGSGKDAKKRVVSEDEVPKQGPVAGSKEEREFLEVVQREVALPDYDLFEDYNEMVTQFGYVALWSTIWPLAPVMALANNFLEDRSDAFKITVHVRRPIPTRTDTIGPWLDTLTFLVWLSALTNSSLVYLFRPAHVTHRELVTSAMLIALASSHGYLLLRVLVRHVVDRVAWSHSEEVWQWERSEREVKSKYLQSVEGCPDHQHAETDEDSHTEDAGFWEFDDGLEEIRCIGKHV